MLLVLGVYPQEGRSICAILSLSSKTNVFQRPPTGFPTEAHDLPVSLIATPDELIEVNRPPAPPAGIDWSLLPPQALEEMPLLDELKHLLSARSGEKRGRKGRP
jgi:hypothetical protein